MSLDVVHKYLGTSDNMLSDQDLNHFIICKCDVCTVSHFSYAPLFQGPYFLTKILESNILYDNLLIDMLSVC